MNGKQLTITQARQIFNVFGFDPFTIKSAGKITCNLNGINGVHHTSFFGLVERVKESNNWRWKFVKNPFSVHID